MECIGSLDLHEVKVTKIVMFHDGNSFAISRVFGLDFVRSK